VTRNRCLLLLYQLLTFTIPQITKKPIHVLLLVSTRTISANPWRLGFFRVFIVYTNDSRILWEEETLYPNL